MPRRDDSDEAIETLRAKLEASELRHEVNQLRSVITQLERELKESNKLLRTQRLPPRIKLSQMQRQQIAARQKWQCVGEDCPLKLINPPGLFTPETLYEIDHIKRWSRCGRQENNVCALCPFCHSSKTRREVLQDDSDSDNNEHD